jgi:hypothetical protein
MRLDCRLFYRAGYHSVIAFESHSEDAVIILVDNYDINMNLAIYGT